MGILEGKNGRGPGGGGGGGGRGGESPLNIPSQKKVRPLASNHKNIPPHLKEDGGVHVHSHLHTAQGLHLSNILTS